MNAPLRRRGDSFEACGAVRLRSRSWELMMTAVVPLMVLVGLAWFAQQPRNRTEVAAGPLRAGSYGPVAHVDVELSADEIVASGFLRPVQVTHAGDGSNRLFVLEKAGYIRVIEEGSVLPTTFLVITDVVDSGAGERGLLGLAFHPNYEANGFLYVNYTRKGSGVDEGDTVIARYAVSAEDPDVADPDSAVILLVVDQPYANHNGGNMVFGPDGYLYIGMGDGGSGGDPANNGQDETTLLGAMLRISVGHSLSYTIPSDNPYVGTEGADEIWAIGLRNPWRFSFDRETGDLYIGDVGQNAWEEIDYLPATTPGGVNFGWRCREGTHTYSSAPPCDDPAWLATLTDPIAEYSHSEGRSVTGGFVYRGTEYPSLVGRYFYADYAEGRIWSIDTTTWSTPELELDTNLAISSFGEDERGELYVVDYSGGTIRRLKETSGPDPDLSDSTKSASSASADPGDLITYTIQLINTGGPTAGQVLLTDTLPTGLNYVAGSLTATGGVVEDAQDPTLRWRGVLTAPPAVTVTYQVTVAAGEGSLVNRARITAAAVQPITLSHALFVPRSVLTTTREDFFLPGTQPGHLEDEIPSTLDCDICHTAPIYDEWRGSMMTQSGRDPVMWAALSIANADAPGAGDFCLRCHAPKGWLEGRSSPADGSALFEEDLEAGIACEVCHRLVDPIPTTAPTDETAHIDAMVREALTTTVPLDHPANGMMIVDPEDNRRGPFSFDVSLPFHTAYRSSFFEGTNNYFDASRLCGTCHNVDNPILSWDAASGQFWPNGNDLSAPSYDKGQLFPLERTFDEWANSAFATEEGVYAPQFAGDKPDGIVRSCQDCHMRRAVGAAADEAFNPLQRDCISTGCLPAHDLTGGNTWVPQLLQDKRWRLHSADEAAYLSDTVLRARELLRKAAKLAVTMEVSGTDKLARVWVINETGHKLPTGYPEGRRMWIHLQALDRAGALIYESGVYNATNGVLIEDPDIKVYEIKQGLTPELAAALGRPDLSGETFHFVLNNTVVKDNRIPPRGYTRAAFDQPGLRPVGAAYADGQYWDDIVYRLPMATERVVATLYYQTSSKEYVDFLSANGGLDGAILGELWQSSKSPPEAVAVARYPGLILYFPVIWR